MVYWSWIGGADNNWSGTRDKMSHRFCIKAASLLQRVAQPPTTITASRAASSTVSRSLVSKPTLSAHLFPLETGTLASKSSDAGHCDCRNALRQSQCPATVTKVTGVRGPRAGKSRHLAENFGGFVGLTVCKTPFRRADTARPLFGNPSYGAVLTGPNHSVSTLLLILRKFKEF